MEYYFIKYTYYQYNSGAADNGTYTRKIDFTNKDEAFAVYEKFKQYFKEELTQAEKDDLVDNYIPYSGFFKEAKIFHAIVTELTI